MPPELCATAHFDSDGVLDKFHLNGFWYRLRAPKSIRRENINLNRWHKNHYRSVRIHLPFQQRRLVRNTDVFCVGSDQVWNTYHHFDAKLFLDFAGEKRRISYASSVGTAQINPRYADAVRDFLGKFDRISVREETGRKVLEKLTDRKDIERVLDPTLLMTKEDWLRFSSNAHFGFDVPKRYLLVYLLANNQNYALDLEEVKRRYGVDDVIHIPSCEAPDLKFAGTVKCYGLTPTEFVWLIAHASVVCTDSFHATIFSINLEREFVVFKRFVQEAADSQNSRLYDVLKLFELDSRWYVEKSQEWARPIDWGKTSETLELERGKSMMFLKGAIG